MEDQTERLKDQVSILTQEKNMIANRLARCQRQLAQAHADCAIAWGELHQVLEKGVVRGIEKIIESTEFAKGF